jgi:hypothetical protein
MKMNGRKETLANHRITVSLLGSGYAAIHLVDVTEEGRGTYTDVQQTGFGRYATREEAEREASDWAEAEEMPLLLSKAAS